MPIADVTDVIAAIAAGEIVIVVDDEDRENEGDFIIAADAVTEAQMAFIINHSSGYVCVPMLGSDLDRLELPLMVVDNEDSLRTAYTISCDAAEGVSTGISAADRARTINLLADDASTPATLVRPGHVIPLRYKPGGVLRRPGHTEASVDLAILGGRRPAAAICEVVNNDGTMARLADLEVLAEEHGLLIGTIADLVTHRRATEETIVERVADAAVPTPYGEWRMIGYRSLVDGEEQVAMVHGDLAAAGDDLLVRLHSECLTGDVFGSARCDCGAQLDLAMARIADAGAGVIVYLRGHEGRGIGLLQKLRAYELQDAGADTVEANERLGLPVDSRDYGIGAMILADLGVHTIRLMTNNPEKPAALHGFGISVSERVPLQIATTDFNRFYLQTKRDRMGHLLDEDAPSGEGIAASNHVGDIAGQRTTAPAVVERSGGAFAVPEGRGTGSVLSPLPGDGGHVATERPRRAPASGDQGPSGLAMPRRIVPPPKEVFGDREPEGLSMGRPA